MALIADTSGLYASIDRDEADYPAVRRIIEAERGPIFVPDLVIAELDSLLLTRVGTDAEMAFLDDLIAGAYTRVSLEEADLERARSLLSEYAEHKIGLTDASILAVAERLKVPRILTLDARHFRVLRFKNRKPLTLLPADD